MTETTVDYPLVVVGAGAGGLVVAIGAAKAGKKVLMIERGTYGGDCTNFGCIPSKALIAAAELAHGIKASEAYGVAAPAERPIWSEAFTRTRRIVQEILHHEDPQALKEHGVDALTGTASFVDSHTLEVSDASGNITTVRAKQIVLATGSRPLVPPIKGLLDTPYLTNETLFDLEKPPASIIVMGGGPIGSEMTQALCRLGSRVTLVQREPHVLMKEDSEAAHIVQEAFVQEGITLQLSSMAVEVRYDATEFQVDVKDGEGKVHTLVAQQLLVATGRVPNSHNLGLDKAGVTATPQGYIEIDTYGRTSQKHIWAVGDITGYALFTHMAENQGRTVLTNLLLPWPFRKKLDLKQSVPRVTYTDPELAHVGLSEEEAIAQYGAKKIAVYRVPLKEVDRAITAGRTEGLVKVVTKRWSSKILGATIVAPRAGEMLCEISLAKHAGVPLRKLSGLIHPYPTYSLALRRASDGWLKETILPAVMKLIGR